MTSSRKDRNMRRAILPFSHPVRNTPDSDPLYDPRRDGSLGELDLTGELLGDPPPLRRALMAKVENIA